MRGRWMKDEFESMLCHVYVPAPYEPLTDIIEGIKRKLLKV